MKQILLLFSLFLFLCSVQYVEAQTDSIRTQHIDEVLVTASAKPSATLSSNPVQTLSVSDIDRLGIQSVSDAIRRFSGVVVKDYGGIGGFKTVAIRGNGAEHTAILYDGMAVSNSQSGQVDIGRFSLENVQMLSLNIGQSDDIFRSAKAMASVGSINIQTITPRFGNKKQLISANIRTGSWGLFNPYIYYAQKLDSKFSLSLDGNWQRADGRYKYERKNESVTEKAKRKNTDVSTRRTELNIFGDLTSSQKISLKTYYYDSERGLPGPYILYFGDSNPNQRIWDKVFFTQGKYSNQINERLKFELQGKYTHTDLKWRDIDAKYENGKIEDRYNSNELYFTGMALYQLTDNISFSLAEDFTYNNLNASYSGFVEPERYTSQTSLSAKYENRKIILIGNILGTYIKEKAQFGDQPENKKRLSPALSASYRPFMSVNLRLRASYKDIFRTPTFNDLYYRGIGNSSIVPEKARQLNAGLTWSNRFSDVFNYFNITADAYYNKIKDKIVINESQDFPRMINLGEVEIKGVDIQTNANISLSDKIQLNISGSYTYQYAIDVTSSTDKHYRDQIPYTPKHLGAASISIDNPWVNFAYSLVASDKRYFDHQNIDRNKVDGYTDHSISLNKTFNLKAFAVRLQGDITNITNKTYYVIYDYPMPGRGYRISLNIKF